MSPEGTEQVVEAVEPTEQNTEGVSNAEEATPNFETDREDVRQMSTFLRDFQKQTEGGTQEPVTADAGTPDAQDEVAEETAGEAATEEESPSAESDVSAGVIKLPDGRELTPEQVLEYEKGHMMQADYTKKTQALAEERKALEAEKEKTDKALKWFQDYERDPVGTAMKLQEEAESQGIYEPKDPETLAHEDKLREIKVKEQQLAEKEKQVEQEAAYRDLDNRMNTLEQKYGEDFDRQKVTQFMIDEQIFSPETAFKAIRHDQLESKTQTQVEKLEAELKEAKKAAVNEYVKTKTTKKSASLPVGAGGNKGSAPIQVNRPKTLEDAKKAALAREW